MSTDQDDVRWPRLDDPRGPARPIDHEDARRMIEIALDSAQPLAPVRPLRARRWRTTLLVAAAITIASVAAAAIALRAARAPLPPLPPLSSASSGALAPGATDSPSVAEVAPSLPSADAARSPVQVGDASAMAPARENAAAGRRADPGHELARANALRGQRKWHDAEAAYERVRRIAPDSPEAQAARIASADLRLRQLHDTEGARRLFLEAQRRGGPLAEEAAWGLVETHRANGDRDGEARALTKFLEAFPGGAMAPRARARARELSSSAP
jgi:hypothetical protein